jgi:hypothetical protein
LRDRKTLQNEEKQIQTVKPPRSTNIAAQETSKGGREYFVELSMLSSYRRAQHGEVLTRNSLDKSLASKLAPSLAGFLTVL